MIKRLIFILMIGWFNPFYSQTGTPPTFINYQAVLRDASGNELPAGTNATINFKIYNTAVTGTVAYEENQSVVVPATKVISLKIGTGIAVSGSFSQINWETGDVHYQVSINSVAIGSKMPFATVPYSFFTGRTSIGGLPPGTRNLQTVYWDSIQNKWTASVNLNHNGDKVGVGMFSTRSKMSVLSANPNDSSALFSFKINGTNGNAAFRGVTTGSSLSNTVNPTSSALFGGDFSSANTGQGSAIGASGFGISSNGTAFGLFGVGQSNNVSGVSIGVFGTTNGNSNILKYAGFFDKGMVYVKDSMFVDVNSGNVGDVLMKTPTGRARWTTLSGNSTISLTPLGIVNINPSGPSSNYTISAIAPQFTSTGIGNIISSTYPTYSLNIPAPIFTGLGLANVNTGPYPNYSVNVPMPNMSFNNTSGTYSFVQGTYSNSLNLSPNLSIAGNTLSVAGNTLNLASIIHWQKPSIGVVALTDVNDNVGIGIGNPSGKLQVIGNVVVPGSSSYRYSAPKIKYYKVGAFEMQSVSSSSYQAAIDDGFHNTSPTILNGLNSLWANGGLPGNPAYFTAVVHLPDSAIINGLSALVVKNGGLLQSVVELWRIDGTGYLSSNAQLIANCQTTNSAGSVVSINAGSVNPLYNVVNNGVYVYFLRYIGEQNTQNLRFHQATITYQINRSEY